MTKVYIAIILVCASLAACGAKKDPDKDSRFDGNRKMVAILDSIGKVANAQNNFYLSESRASNMLSTKLKQFRNTEEEMQWTMKYNYELLSSAKPDQAAANLRSFLEANGGLQDAIKKPGYKMVYNVLAISYLRQGELENCVSNHNSSSCIVPFAPDAMHKKTTGSEKAIEIYSILLENDPKDYQSLWLMNIAYMSLGKYPALVPEKWRIPEAAMKPGKIDFKPFKDVAIPLGLDENSMSGGACLEDFNNDGFLDIFYSSYSLFDNVKFFQNNGDGTFKNMTESAQLNGITGGLNLVQADYDNDGFTDILLLRGAWLDEGGEWPNSLLHNNGDGTFSDKTIEAGMLTFCPTETASWADFNNDGFLDVYIANENNAKNAYPCELWVNNGNGTFKNVAKQLGMDGNFGWVKACIWSDFNNDGKPDLYLSLIKGENKLFMNRGGTKTEDWKFEEIGKKAGVLKPFYSFPVIVFDYNNDGWQDIFCTGFDMGRLNAVASDCGREFLGLPPVTELGRLFKNNGDETFTDVTVETGLDKPTYAMGMNFGDLDNDGWLDIYCGTGAIDFTTLAPNRMFKNMGGKKFQDVSMNGFGHLQKGHGIAFGDLDNDGDQDIFCKMGGAYLGDKANNLLFENPNEDLNKWITIKVEGKKLKSAIGSRIKVNVITADNEKRSIYVAVNSGGTFGASSLQQEIGLGNAKEIESVEVFWQKPGFPVTKYNGIKYNTYIKLLEGETKPIIEERKSIHLKTEGTAHEH